MLKWETARAKEYEIQVSNDAKKWKTVYTNKDGQGSTDEIKLSPVTARYVKMAGVSRATDFGYSLYEFEIYGKKQTDSAPFHPVRTD